MAETPETGIAGELQRMIDSFVAIELRRDELPAWKVHVSELVEEGRVYVMDPNLGPTMVALLPKVAREPLWVVAARSLTQEEQEAAIRIFVAKRDRAPSPSTQDPR